MRFLYSICISFVNFIKFTLLSPFLRVLFWLNFFSNYISYINYVYREVRICDMANLGHPPRLHYVYPLPPMPLIPPAITINN